MNSEDLYRKAVRLFPGGVNSPVRAFSPYPFFVKQAHGSKLTSVDERNYVDYCMSYGAVLFGHAYPPIMDAVSEAIENGTIFGTPSEREVELGELITKIVPSMEMMRFVNSGTEATMHAVRLARGYTGKKKIVKFEGCYHGAHDSLLAGVGSGAATFGVASSGVPEDVARNTIVLPYNNVEKLERALNQDANQVAAVIIEPVIGNSGLILPKRGYLQKLRELTKRHGIILIFDEVITGFRLGIGGAQEYFGVQSDLVTFGKVVGGGLPFAFFGGRRDIMENLAPKGKVYQAGTYGGNHLCVSVALCVIHQLRSRKTIYSVLDKKCETIVRAMSETISKRGLDASVIRIGSMFQIFFTRNRIIDYANVLTSDTLKFGNYFSKVLSSGIFIPPSQFETCFLSAAHNETDVDETIEKINKVLAKI